MSSQKNEVVSDYYSGQGVVLIGPIDPTTNRPKYFEPMGNVTDLKINITTQVIEHKGSQDGQRAVDKRIQTETKGNVSFTTDNWQASVIARAARGEFATVAGGNVVDTPVPLYLGKIAALEHIQISSLVVEQGGTALTQFVNDSTNWDYKANLEAGSILINDDPNTADKLGVVATGVTVGATTSITVANTVNVGDTVYLRGFTGANATKLNNKSFVAAAGTNGTTIVVPVTTTGDTITAGANSRVVFERGVSLDVSYTYAEQKLVDALTQPMTEVALRFEGLNTADENSPVVVEVFRFSTDPLKELALISDTFGAFQLEGSLLADNTRTVGSKYFQVKKLK